ncbi:MAG: hypothetical protein WCF84_17200 [Anaerolineae bacterium]
MRNQYYSSELSAHILEPLRGRLFQADGYVEALALAIHTLGALGRLREELTNLDARSSDPADAEPHTVSDLRIEGYRDGMVWAIQLIQQQEIKSPDGGYDAVRPQLYAQMLFALGRHDGLEFAFQARANLANLGAESYQVQEQIRLYQLATESYESGYLVGLREAARVIEEMGKLG